MEYVIVVIPKVSQLFLDQIWDAGSVLVKHWMSGYYTYSTVVGRDSSLEASHSLQSAITRSHNICNVQFHLKLKAFLYGFKRRMQWCCGGWCRWWRSARRWWIQAGELRPTTALTACQYPIIPASYLTLPLQNYAVLTIFSHIFSWPPYMDHLSTGSLQICQVNTHLSSANHPITRVS